MVMLYRTMVILIMISVVCDAADNDYIAGRSVFTKRSITHTGIPGYIGYGATSTGPIWTDGSSEVHTLMYEGASWTIDDLTAHTIQVTNITAQTLNSTNVVCMAIRATSYSNASGNNIIASTDQSVTVTKQVSGTYDISINVRIAPIESSNSSQSASIRQILTKSAYSVTFTQASLSSSILVVNHNLTNRYNMVAVYDNAASMVIPSRVWANSTTQSVISMSGFVPITGTWRAIITKGRD